MITRVSSNQNVFDIVLISDLQELQRLTIETLIRDFNTSQNKFEYVKLSAFKDGHGYNLTSSEKQSFLSGESSLIGNLPCSIRVTNVQLFNESVKKIVTRLYERLNLVVTANLYVTPNADSQCFLYHGDPHDSLIYQVMGQKDWSFPLLENKEAFVKPLLRANASAFNQKKIAYTDEIHVLKERTALTFPYNRIHKATNLDSQLSVHLTFSSNIPNAFEIQSYILGHLLGLKNINDHFHQRISEEELNEKMQTQQLDVSQLVASYYKEFAESEKNILQLGRKY